MAPAIMQKSRYAPQNAQGFDSAGSRRSAQVFNLPVELFQYFGYFHFRLLIVAADEHSWLAILNTGSTITIFPMLLNAFTKCICGKPACNFSMSDSLALVKNLSTPSFGGTDANGLVVSITVLPCRFSGPAKVSMSIAASPLPASTMTSPNFAASSKLPVKASFPAVSFQAARLKYLSS